jgi:hypothetical protein
MIAPTKNGKRYILTFSIGLKRPVFAFEDAVIKEACAQAGGCTVSRMIGYWIEGGEYPDTRYTGPYDEEFCFRIEIMCLVSDCKAIYQGMRACIRQVARKYDLNIDWVQVTRHEAMSLNFSVKEWMNK